VTVTCEQAGANALRRYLETRLLPLYADLVVDDRWPEQGRLPPRAITILRAGEPVREKVDIRDVKFEAIDATTGLYSWRVAASRQAMQLDVWATKNTVRDDLLAVLERELHRGIGVTLGITNADPWRDGVLLPLDPADGHEGFVDFAFEGAQVSDESDASERSEHRALIRCQMAVDLVFKTESPRLLNVAIATSFGLSAPQAPGQQQDTYTIELATGKVTHTSP
jgi:hypothetical protein